VDDLASEEDDESEASGSEHDDDDPTPWSVEDETRRLEAINVSDPEDFEKILNEEDDEFSG